MDVRIFTEPQQGATYEELLAVARTAETCGIGGFFRSDHYLGMGPMTSRQAIGSTDAWATLAALSRETSTIRLGTLLTAGTFRLPGPLAITVAQVDEMSGGRIELGLGAGWYEAEHRAYGIPFPASARERLDRLDEQLVVITGLWAASPGDPFSFDGRYYQVSDSPGLPKPVQIPRPPIIIGGHGTRRTPAIAARHGDEFNIAFSSVDEVATILSAVDRACETAQRDPKSLLRSIALTTVCGETDAEIERRARAIDRDVEALRAVGLIGRPEEIARQLEAFAAIGIERVYAQILDLTDLEHVELIGTKLAPVLRTLTVS